jgi:hypothetical protein
MLDKYTYEKEINDNMDKQREVFIYQQIEHFCYRKILLVTLFSTTKIHILTSNLYCNS